MICIACFCCTHKCSLQCHHSALRVTLSSKVFSEIKTTISDITWFIFQLLDFFLVFQGCDSDSATKIRSAHLEKKNSKEIENYSSDEALAMMLHLDISKENYKQLRNGAVVRNLPNLYPSYQMVSEAAERCIPDSNCITVTESGAKVKLQALLDHTCTRILLEHETALLSGARYYSFARLLLSTFPIARYRKAWIYFAFFLFPQAIIYFPSFLISSFPNNFSLLI